MLLLMGYFTLFSAFKHKICDLMVHYLHYMSKCGIIKEMNIEATFKKKRPFIKIKN